MKVTVKGAVPVSGDAEKLASGTGSTTWALIMIGTEVAPATGDWSNAMLITITHRTVKGNPFAFFREMVMGFMICSDTR
jgi:hypothetical protein